jgi:WD40 repeat protein
MRLRCVVTLLFVAILAASFRVAPLAAEQAQRSEWLLAADATTDKAAEPAAPRIAHVVLKLSPLSGATSVAWSPDGKLLATMGGIRQRLTLWDARTGKTLWETVGDFGGGQALAFSNDSRLLLASTATRGPEDRHATLTLWDVATGAVAGRVAGPFPNEDVGANFARKLALDREHGLMAVIPHHLHELVAIYDMRDWTLKGTVTVERHAPEDLAFGADAAVAVATLTGQIAIFDADSRTLTRTFHTHGSTASIAYSPDGKYVATGFNFMATAPDRIRIWRSADGKLVRSYGGDFSDANGLAWSPDGRYLASACSDKKVRIWQMTTDDPGQVVTTFYESALSVAFSPDGAFLAAAGSDGAVIAEIK